MKYLNLGKVLPPEVLAEVQRFAAGACWIPVRVRRRFKTASNPSRDKEIRRLRDAGRTYRAIGEQFRLAASVIWTICNKAPGRRGGGRRGK